MSSFNPGKLSVEFVEGVTAKGPVIPRRYTLTHSDVTGELFLTIGATFAYDKITAMRDEVLGEWVRLPEGYVYQVYLHVDGKLFKESAAIRNQVFRHELPLALQAIRYGDGEFFSLHPELDHYPIMIYFRSSYPEYNQVENWGSFSRYITDASHRALAQDTPRQNRYLLDSKVGDVTGDGIPDKVSLYGQKTGGTEEVFSENITIEIEDGRTKEIKSITPEFNSGYNARLFLGDFTRDKIADIKLSIDSGGSGGYGSFYIYSYKNSLLKEIFNFSRYNEDQKYRVDYADNYRVDIGNVSMDKLFIIDISGKGYDYLSQYYTENGKLKHPLQGEVLALGSLIPFVDDEKNSFYNLLAFQRIIGTNNSDTLGFIQNLLTWDGQKFKTSLMFTAITGTKLATLYQI